MKKIKYLKFFICSLIASIYSLTLDKLAYAGKISEGVNQFGTQVYGGGYTPPQQIAALIIQGLLTFLAIIFVILIIYGGFLYMTAMGESDKVKKGKSVITYAVIGLIIIISAYAITRFVFDIALNTAGGGYSGGSYNETGPGETGSP